MYVLGASVRELDAGAGPEIDVTLVATPEAAPLECWVCSSSSERAERENATQAPAKLHERVTDVSPQPFPPVSPIGPLA